MKISLELTGKSPRSLNFFSTTSANKKMFINTQNNENNMKTAKKLHVFRGVKKIT